MLTQSFEIFTSAPGFTVKLIIACQNQTDTQLKPFSVKCENLSVYLGVRDY